MLIRCINDAVSFIQHHIKMLRKPVVRKLFENSFDISKFLCHLYLHFYFITNYFQTTLLFYPWSQKWKKGYYCQFPVITTQRSAKNRLFSVTGDLGFLGVSSLIIVVLRLFFLQKVLWFVFSSILFWKTNQVRIIAGPQVFLLKRWPNCYLTLWEVLHYKKNFGQKFWHKKLYKMPKNGFEACAVSSEQTF